VEDAARSIVERALDELRRDVTAAAEELQATNELLRQRTDRLHRVETALAVMLDEAHQVVLAVDDALTIEAWSVEAERWSGVPADRALGRRLGDVVEGDIAPELLRAVRTSVETHAGETGLSTAVTIGRDTFRIRALDRGNGALVIGPCTRR
jgi:PAS domain-containing protein